MIASRKSSELRLDNRWSLYPSISVTMNFIAAYLDTGSNSAKNNKNMIIKW